MNYYDYINTIKVTPETQDLEYGQALMWLHPEKLPLGVFSLNGCTDKIIRIPEKAVNSYGLEVAVIGIGCDTFQGNTTVTDVILHPGTRMVGGNTFAGCTALERIYFPKQIKRISKYIFSGFTSLTDVYYEGSYEDWKELEPPTEKRIKEFGDLIPGTPVQKVTYEKIVRKPGIEALSLATIHFNCKFPE